MKGSYRAFCILPVLISLLAVTGCEEPIIDHSFLTGLTTQSTYAKACADLKISNSYTKDNVIENRIVYSDEFKFLSFLPVEGLGIRARETYVYSLAIHNSVFENTVVTTTNIACRYTFVGISTTLTPIAPRAEILTGNIFQNRIADAVTNYGQTDVSFPTTIYNDLVENVSCISPSLLTSKPEVELLQHTLNIETEEDLGYYYPVIKTSAARIAFLSVRVVTELYQETKNNKEIWEITGDYETTLAVVLVDVESDYTLTDMIDGPYETMDDYFDIYLGTEKTN